MEKTAIKGELTAEQLKELETKGRIIELPQGEGDAKYMRYQVVTGEVDEKQLQAWKNEFANRVFSVEVLGEQLQPNVQEVLVGYFRKPDRTHIARAMGYINANQTIEAGESILDDTWLGGNERLRSIKYEDTEYRVATANELYLRTSVFEAKIKNV